MQKLFENRLQQNQECKFDLKYNKQIAQNAAELKVVTWASFFDKVNFFGSKLERRDFL